MAQSTFFASHAGKNIGLWILLANFSGRQSAS